jgi:hypothetical protein
MWELRRSRTIFQKPWDSARTLSGCTHSQPGTNIKGKGETIMRSLNRLLLITLLCLPVFAALPGQAQTKAPKPESKAAVSPEMDAKEKNLQAYISLLRADVRQEKAEIMGSIMLLNAADAAKFWPIYDEYDRELTKLNDQRVANIREYGRVYEAMTDAKADELIQGSLTYQRQRIELLAKAYGRIKQAVGAITAARFLQIEHQLLLVIDLQITSSLPIVGQGS